MQWTAILIESHDTEEAEQKQRDVEFSNKLALQSEEYVAFRRTPKLDDHPLSAVHDCLFNIFAAILCIWEPSFPHATQRRALLWWKQPI